MQIKHVHGFCRLSEFQGKNFKSKKFLCKDVFFTRGGKKLINIRGFDRCDNGNQLKNI